MQSHLLPALVVLAGCTPAPSDNIAEPTGDAPTATNGPATTLANPASENCLANGGRHTVETSPGGQYERGADAFYRGACGN